MRKRVMAVLVLVAMVSAFFAVTAWAAQNPAQEGNDYDDILFKNVDTVTFYGQVSKEDMERTMILMFSIPANVRKSFEENGWKVRFHAEPLEVSEDGGKTVAQVRKESKVVELTVGYDSALIRAFANYFDQSLVRLGGHYLSETEEWRTNAEAEGSVFIENFDDTYRLDNTASGLFKKAFAVYCADAEALKEKCPTMWLYIERMVRKAR